MNSPLSNGQRMTLTAIKLTDREFSKLSKFIYNECGINLTANKRTLLENRLQKRIRDLGFNSFSEYSDYVMTPKGKVDELISMIDAVATNKTDFFREPQHFHFLATQVIPEWYRENEGKVFKVWSSACSTGEEPFTLAMVLEDMSVKYSGFNYRVVATDISTKALDKAIQATYTERAIAGIPMVTRKNYLLRSQSEPPTIRISQQIRSKVVFKRMNLMDQYLDVEGGFDVIFCRNVLIYFDRQTQEQVVRKLLAKLSPGGYFMIGHSESVYQMDLPLRQVQPTIFQKI